MDLRLVERLTTGEGWGLLQSLPPYDESAALSLGVRLRDAGFDPDLVAATLTQSRLRSRAVHKFGDGAAEMLFTADGLEQATRAEVAATHAQRFRQAGVQHVFDLGCGIGSDAMALARAGMRVHAVDADETTAAIAGVNLRPWPTASAHTARAEEVTLPTGADARTAGIWLDPARRTPGVADITGRTRRLFRLEDLSPGWDFVRRAAQSVPAAGAKLSPAFSHRQVPPGAEAQWTSYRGEVVECTIWWGSLVHEPGRTALMLNGRDAYAVTEADAAEADPTPASLGRLPGYLYEADRAVLRAGLVGALIRAVDGQELAPGTGYVCSTREVHVTWAKRYAVREAFPFNVKALRAWMRDHDVGRVTIKKRGVSLDPETLRRQLRLSGSREITVLVTRIDDLQSALVLDAV
ncbi:class I SAM-dependent methyltransferase [Leekyejoonella antrihumi]|uniref:Class I SAM-dependent methyltransferase n=2 Tax=Leekyejoonella antrihumi TaxID=1660198 RepID=A0A563E1S7_9MICO|nr:class I SAM-dependent methyltransferase [Leekyejoonella antrihumi]TWP36249.1 class I SAM-dependent methyltransferase [Leekyejoonella antrihumi]